MDYDNAYQIAQTVVLEAARRETLKVFASVSAKKASKTYDVPVGQLAAPGKIDMDRKHLVSATHGETYPTLSLAPNDRAVFYNVQISEPDFKAAKTRLTKLHKHHLGQSPSKTPLKINKDIEHWFKLYSNPFSMAETTPTEAQLCLALRLEWGDQTQHRDVARNLIRFVPRAMGAPKKSARNQRS